MVSRPKGLTIPEPSRLESFAVVPIMSGTVLPAYLHPNVVSHSFSDSMTRLLAYDLGHAGRVVRAGGPVMFRCGPGGLVEARNQVMQHFLDESSAEWLWMVDSDMGFAPDIVERLVAVADPAERPVVGALCFGLRETQPDGMQGWVTRPFPTLYQWASKPDGETGFLAVDSYPVNTLVRVAGTGAACLLVHRSAAMAVRAAEGDVWFERTRYPSGAKVSEDLSFCYRLATAGVPVYVHTGIRTSHHKQVWLGEGDFWRELVAEPATEQTAVVVPVMRRPQNAEPFMRSLRASTGLATAYAVVDDQDEATRAAWAAAGARVVDFADDTGPGTFAEKVNAGFRRLPVFDDEYAPWLFLVGDDVRFEPGWLDHAQAVASDHHHVIGTNDLANPRVLAGEHATHLLVRRSYVDEVGASWDGPGIVAHEGYGHWYVDDEIVTAAKQRGVWAMALGSRVEHLHPLWGTAPDDETYRLGQARAKADAELFRARLRQNAKGTVGAATP